MRGPTCARLGAMCAGGGDRGVVYRGREGAGKTKGAEAPFESPAESDRRQWWLRSSRRRILPTGVLGSDSRNSITRGCL